MRTCSPIRRSPPKPIWNGWPGGSASLSNRRCPRRAGATGCAPHRRWRAGMARGAAWRLALDVATGGGVRGGEIVLLEHFRLRRLLATLLGVDLAGSNDPLLPGLHQSGNSIVGDTLILSDTETVELLALFREEVATAAENAAVDRVPRPARAPRDGARAPDRHASGPRLDSPHRRARGAVPCRGPRGDGDVAAARRHCQPRRRGHVPRSTAAAAAGARATCPRSAPVISCWVRWRSIRA